MFKFTRSKKPDAWKMRMVFRSKKWVRLRVWVLAGWKRKKKRYVKIKMLGK